VKPGTIDWVDLTVPAADELRDFYREVCNWVPHPVEMGGYADYAMAPAGESEPVAGICHGRGVNAGLPPVWIVYIVVADLDVSLRRCEELGGKALGEPRSMGGAARYCVIQDPAGAVCALYQPG